MSLPTVHLALRRAYLAQAEAFPEADPEYKRACGDHSDAMARFDAAEDANVCLGCLREEIESLADYVGGGATPTTRPCSECSPDGMLDTEWARREGSCTFGCGSKVNHDEGGGFCCGDHSANRAECSTCGRVYEDWDHGTFAVTL